MEALVIPSRYPLIPFLSLNRWQLDKERQERAATPHMNRDKRCHVSITIVSGVGNQILLSVLRANTRLSTRATLLTLDYSETL